MKRKRSIFCILVALSVFLSSCSFLDESASEEQQETRKSRQKTETSENTLPEQTLESIQETPEESNIDNSNNDDMGVKSPQNILTSNLENFI